MENTAMIKTLKSVYKDYDRGCSKPEDGLATGNFNCIVLALSACALDSKLPLVQITVSHLYYHFLALDRANRRLIHASHDQGIVASPLGTFNLGTMQGAGSHLIQPSSRARDGIAELCLNPNTPTPIVSNVGRYRDVDRRLRVVRHDPNEILDAIGSKLTIDELGEAIVTKSQDIEQSVV